MVVVAGGGGGGGGTEVLGPACMQGDGGNAMWCTQVIYHNVNVVSACATAHNPIFKIAPVHVYSYIFCEVKAN